MESQSEGSCVTPLAGFSFFRISPRLDEARVNVQAQGTGLSLTPTVLMINHGMADKLPDMW